MERQGREAAVCNLASAAIAVQRQLAQPALSWQGLCKAAAQVYNCPAAYGTATPTSIFSTREARSTDWRLGAAPAGCITGEATWEGGVAAVKVLWELKRW